MTVRRFFILLISVVLLSPLTAEICLSQSAWQKLVRQNPAVVDDPSVDWRERLILDVLTPEQAQRFYWGTSPDDLVLESGKTLAEYLAARLNPPGNVYVPLPGSCELFSVEDLLVDESLSVQVRGLCGIPEEATAVILQVKAESMGAYPRVKVWASDLPEPAEAVIEGSNAAFEDLRAMTAVVTLCAKDRCRGGELRVKGTDAALVQAEAVGYFRPLSPTDGVGPVGGIRFYTEGSDNNFFGTGAGASNGACDPGTSWNSCYNSFFGADAGFSNTMGSFNAFFGDAAGYSNTTGYSNAFFGTWSGHSNTTGSFNAFFGNQAGYSATSGYSNAFFGDVAGFSNTTGSFNAFFGTEAGTSNTTGNENAFFGTSAGRSNTTGNGNSFFGQYAGHDNTEGSSNAFFGGRSGVNNTTGNYNGFFGNLAGLANTTGNYNAFFGFAAGYSNTTGNWNSFFGRYAGLNNTTGSSNAFFGDGAGDFNFVENKNTFVGAYSNLDPGPDPATAPVTNATAIGANSYVSQSNSLVLGSINGVNEATANTQVGIGTTAPQRLLHIAGNNAVFRMDRSTNSAAFMLVRTDNGGGVLKNFVIGVNASGTNQGEFVINDLGTALGGPGQRRLTINNDGDVIINGDLITNAGPLSFPDYVFTKNYDLMPLGELREYVKTQKHLPEIPSAEEIQKQGEINVTELQLKLLRKIEELTLYTIGLQETVDQLKEENRLVNELRSRLEALEEAGVSKP